MSCGFTMRASLREMLSVLVRVRVREGETARTAADAVVVMPERRGDRGEVRCGMRHEGRRDEGRSEGVKGWR